MPQLGPQRGPARAQDGDGLDPQLQSLIDKHGMEAVRAMAKSAMAGGTPSLPSSPAAAPMMSLMNGAAPAAAPAGSAVPRAASNGQSPMNVPGRGRGAASGGFTNPAGMGEAARANETAMRERLFTQMALLKLSQQGGDQKAQPAAQAASASRAMPSAAPVAPAAQGSVHPAAAYQHPVYQHPAGAYQQPTLAPYVPPTIAPAAQAAPQPVAGWKLLIGAVAIAAVVGGGAAYVASKAADEPRRAHR